jgi:regulation of enolase protein 1 (concanavalin A-like superfamily)
MKGKGCKVMVKYARLLMLVGSMALAACWMNPVHAAPPSKVPAGWAAVDIGYDDPAGSTIVDEAKNLWTIEGSGGDIEGTADQFHFAYEKVTGDATITAHFVSMIPANYPWTKVGPMIRVDDTDGAQNVTLNMTSGVGVRIQGRDDLFPTTHDNIPPVLSLSQPQPTWLRLERVGKDVSGFYSQDGNIWYWGGGTLTMSDLKDEALIGLAVTAHQSGELATAVFDNVSVTKGPALVYGLKACLGDKAVLLSWLPLPGATSYNVYRAPAGETDLSKFTRVSADNLTGTSYTDVTSDLVNNQKYTYLVSPVSKDANGQPVEGGRAAIQTSTYNLQAPNGYAITDINEDPDKALDFQGGCIPPLGAFYEPNSDTTIVRGAGEGGLGGTADQFNFTHTEFTGNFQVTVKALTRPVRTSPNSKAGLMIREGLTPGARRADLVLTGSENGLVFEWRDTADGDAAQADNPLISAQELNPPVWIRLTRIGDKITAEYSNDGTTWVGGSDPANATTLQGLAPTVSVGLAITSARAPDSGRAFTEAAFQGLSIVKQ